jgi:hypothetical protein
MSINTYPTRKIFIIIAIILFCSIGLAESTNGQIFSEYDQLKLSVNNLTPMFFLGDISLTGSFQGIALEYPLEVSNEHLFLLEQYFPSEDIQNFASIDELHSFPVFADTIIPDATVYLINTSIFSDINQFINPELIDDIDSYLTSFSSVSIHITKGIALFGSDVERMQVDLDPSYGIGGLFQFPFPEDSSTTGLGILSDQQSTITVQTDTSVLYPFESEVQIKSKDDINITISDPNILLFINTNDAVTLYQDSVFHFFPTVIDEISTAEAEIILTETKDLAMDPSSLLNELHHLISDIDDNLLTDFLPSDQEFDSIITLISKVLNCGIVVLNSSQSILIDEVQIPPPTVLVGRGSDYTITMKQQLSSPIQISGRSSLIFLDDHIYISNLAVEDKGISLPFWSILLYSIAAVSILCYVFVKKKRCFISENIDEPQLVRKRWFRFLLYIGLFLIFFVLVDWEFSFRFGISFFTLLSLQTETLFIIIFLLAQLLIILLLLVLYALPGLIIHNMICKTTLKNRYQFFTKILVILPLFWFGIQIYFLVLFNVFLSFLPLSSLVGLG